MFTQLYSATIIAAATCVLFYVAYTDLQNYKIKNEMVMLLALLYLTYVFVTGTWSEVLSHLGAAVAIFAVLLFCYGYGWLGGGDVKLLTVAFFWVGAHCAFMFVGAMLTITLIHTGLVYCGVVGAQTIKGRARIAYAPAIAGALVLVFASGCLQHNIQ
jgi:prepilin peptidase CpaA